MWLVDLMHVKYLGTDQYYFASVCCLLVYHIMTKSPQENLADLFAKLNDYWKADGHMM